MKLLPEVSGQAIAKVRRCRWILLDDFCTVLLHDADGRVLRCAVEDRVRRIGVAHEFTLDQADRGQPRLGCLPPDHRLRTARCTGVVSTADANVLPEGWRAVGQTVAEAAQVLRGYHTVGSAHTRPSLQRGQQRRRRSGGGGGVAVPLSLGRHKGNHTDAGAARRKACLAPPTSARCCFARPTDSGTAQPEPLGKSERQGARGEHRAPHPAESQRQRPGAAAQAGNRPRGDQHAARHQAAAAGAGDHWSP